MDQKTLDEIAKKCAEALVSMTDEELTSFCEPITEEEMKEIEDLLK